MRKSDIAYNPPLPNNGEIPKAVEDMTLDELNKEIMKTCAKCHGDYTICEDCRGCQTGRLLVDKLKEGKKDKLAGIRVMYGMSPEHKQQIAKELFKKALMSGNPVQYLMQECGIDEKRAKDRLRVYKKKYAYIDKKLETLRGMAENVTLPKKKMVELVPKKEKTVSELVFSLKEERAKLMERIKEIDNALKVVSVYEQIPCKESAV